jgi:prepilin-type N-terminal cleavage/methylation domain-containing protein
MRIEERVRHSRFAIRDSSSGFTLVEVMIAMAIIAMTAVVLLDQRLEVVRDAARARDLRTSWVLASQKLAELELDRTLWTGVGSQSNGDFAETDAEYASYLWEYQIVRVPIEITDPKDPKSDQKPRELLRLTLGVRAPGIEEPIVLEAEFPIKDPATEPAASGDGKDPAAGSRPPASGGAPGTGDKK